MMEKQIKNKFINIILSFIMPGAGHLYLGLKKQGIILIVLTLIATISGFTEHNVSFLIYPIGIYAIIDSIIKYGKLFKKNDKK